MTPSITGVFVQTERCCCVSQAHSREYSLGFKVTNSVISASLQLSQKHKVGVLLCRAGQSTEEEMYNNEEASPAFSAFLGLLGEQVLLKGFTKYAAQLDTKSESCQELHGNLCFLL